MDVDFNTLFKICSSTNLRGHSLKLCKQKFRLDTMKYFFLQRVIDVCNKLDINLIAFKKHLDEYIYLIRG